MVLGPQYVAEREIALLICAERPERLVRDLAAMVSVARYRLLPRGVQRIRDGYFDTPEGALHSQRLALRIREIDGTPWITLKGPSQAREQGGVERMEIELPWSEETVRRVTEELAERSIALRDFPGLPSPAGPPTEHMRALGFVSVQDRETHRQIRDLVDEAKEGAPVVAEMAIDSVTYRFGHRRVCLHEVEMEVKEGEGPSAIEVAASHLVSRYGTALRPWIHSKLATGKAIAGLLEEGALKGLLDADDNLLPAAYVSIEHRLRRADL